MTCYLSNYYRICALSRYIWPYLGQNSNSIRDVRCVPLCTLSQWFEISLKIRAELKNIQSYFIVRPRWHGYLTSWIYMDTVFSLFLQRRRQNFGSGENILRVLPRVWSECHKILRISKRFLNKLEKLDYFRRFNKISVKFSRFGRNSQVYCKFLWKFSKITLKTAQKCIFRLISN